MRTLIVAALAVGLAGCATGMAGSARNICYKAGYQPGTQAFENCWKGERDEQMAGHGEALLLGAAVGLAATQSSQSSPAYYIPPAPHAPQPPAGSIMCPNGVFVVGRRCVMHPDGTFSGAP